MIRKLFKTVIPSIIILLFLTGCGEQLCSYCGQEKNGKEYDVLGTARFICYDCMNNPEAYISGNVIWDYASSLIDPEVYVPSANLIPETEDTAEQPDSLPDISDIMNDTADSAVNNISDIVTDVSNTVANITDNEDNPDETPSVSTENSTFEPSGAGQAAPIISRLNDLLSKNGYSLVNDNTLTDVYSIEKNNTNQNIKIEFLKDDTNRMVISMAADSDQDLFKEICINSALAYINDTDYETMGNEIYNNAYQYGNYNFDKYSFYYILSSKKELENGISPVRFEIITHH